MTRLNMKFTWYNVFLIILIWPIKAFPQYKFEKVKEFKIPSLSQVELIDYYPQKGLYLGYINKLSKGLEIALINEEGKIIISKNLKGEGPEQYVSSLNSLGFSIDGDIWALTTHQLLRYDQNLKLKERIRYNPNRQIFINGKANPFNFFYKNNDRSALFFIVNPTGTSKYLGMSDFKNTKLIEIFNNKNNVSYEIAPVSERPQYEKLDKSVGDMYFPIYTLDQGSSPKLYMTTSLDNEITVIDLTTNKVISKIKINHGEFKVLDAGTIATKNLSSYENITLASLNHKIFKLDGGFIALEYIREIPYGTYERKISDDPEYHHFKDPDYHRLILFDQTRQLTRDLSIPYGSIKMSLPNNQLLVKIENPESEEDFVKYGIYKLSKE